MTGKLYVSKESLLPKHTSAVITLDKKLNLIFEDVRKFGRIYFYKNLDIINIKHGIEPLSEIFQIKIFQKILLQKSI